ncbi:MAG: ion transporter [Vicinamibacterales bacterium]
MSTPERPTRHPSYELFMLALCVYALIALATRSIAPISSDTDRILNYVDDLVCLVFFGDFLVSLATAPNKWRYLWTWGWIDLISSIPAINAARWGRFARIIRVVRALRGIRVTRELATFLVRHRAENAFLAASLIAVLLLTFCSIAILRAEDVPGANIRNADDAFWWAITTMTTVGYGDTYPITLEGRAIAAVLMSAGVGLFGIFSGFLASWFVGEVQGRAAPDPDIVALRQEIAALREVLKNR